MPITIPGPHFLQTGEVVTFEFSNPAQINQAWGQIIAHMGQEGIMGDHSSAHGAFTPDPFLPDGTVDPHTSFPAREGVGNSSMDNDDFQNPEFDGNNLAGGGNGIHGVFQALRFGDPFRNNPVESQLKPFVPDLHGQVSVSVSDLNI